MDPVIIGIIFLAMWVVFFEFDLFMGIILLITYNLMVPDEEPKIQEPTPVVQSVKPKVEPQVKPKETDVTLLKTQEDCEKSDGVWMYDECIK